MNFLNKIVGYYNSINKRIRATFTSIVRHDGQIDKLQKNLTTLDAFCRDRWDADHANDLYYRKNENFDVHACCGCSIYNLHNQYPKENIIKPNTICDCMLDSRMIMKTLQKYGVTTVPLPNGGELPIPIPEPKELTKIEKQEVAMI